MDCDLHCLFSVKHINTWVEVLEILLEKLDIIKFSTYYALFEIDFPTTITNFKVGPLPDKPLNLLSMVQSKEKHKRTG